MPFSCDKCNSDMKYFKTKTYYGDVCRTYRCVECGRSLSMNWKDGSKENVAFLK